jgi:hypothetical protein
MGRWVRWFGAVAEEEAPPPPRPTKTKVLTISARQARDLARGKPVGSRTASRPTGIMSAEQLPAEMLTAVLVEEGILSVTDEHASLQEHRSTGRPVEEIVCEKGIVPETELVSVVSRRCKVPHLSLERYQMKPELIDLVPAESARAGRVVPLERLGKMLNVATSNPYDLRTLRRLEEETGLRVRPVLATPTELAQCLDKLYPPPEEPEAELPTEEAFTTGQIFKDSWLGLVGEKKEPAAEGAPPAPEAEAGEGEGKLEEAIALSPEETQAFARSSAGSLYRGWAEAVGLAGEEELAASGGLAPLLVDEAEFSLAASPEGEKMSPPEGAVAEAGGPWWKDYDVKDRKVSSSSRARSRRSKKSKKKRKKRRS